MSGTSPRRRVGALAIGWACAAGVAPGCRGANDEPFDVRVDVKADGVRPIAGAQLRVRGDYLGTTNPLGQATLRVPGNEGERLPVSLTCPSGFVAEPAETILVLAEPATTGDEQGAPALELACKTEQREAVVLVHVSGDAASSLPVRVDGVLAGQTDALGFAHVHVRANPESTFEVSLDTSEHEQLLPANPSRQYKLERSDEVFVFDTAFEKPKPARKQRRAPGKRRARAVTG